MLFAESGLFPKPLTATRNSIRWLLVFTNRLILFKPNMALFCEARAPDKNEQGKLPKIVYGWTGPYDLREKGMESTNVTDG